MKKPLLLVFGCASIAAIPTVWLRRRRSNVKLSLRNRRRLYRYHSSTYRWQATDPRSVALKDDATLQSNDSAIYKPIMTPMQVCERMAAIPHDKDMEIMQNVASECPLRNNPPEKTKLLLLDGMNVFGRTGNNLIEFLHSFQYAKENGLSVAIMQGSWPTHMISPMWMAIQGNDINAWVEFVEQEFCVKIIANEEELEKYEEVIPKDTRDLFMLRRKGWQNLQEYIDFQGHIIRTLYRSYNTGVGVNMGHRPVRDMCSVIDSMFGSTRRSAVYSVIHSRYLEGEPGIRLLERIANDSGCDPMAALKMEPEYVKAILEEKGMLEHPIIFISDHEQPEILENLLADPDIGPNIHLIPGDASWVGGDITAAIMANVFIGNPASTFSGFIAKSRVAFGYGDTYLFRKKNEVGEWFDVCDDTCIFDKRVMQSMA